MPHSVVDLNPTQPSTPAFSTRQPLTTTKAINDRLNSFTQKMDQSPTMKLPETVEGFIDLQTLGKIHDALCMSEEQDDLELATWIKANYLFEPIAENEDGRPIRSREGFQFLDKAYKRVRMLTNRAQDKWPFFDRTWKKMTASSVLQAALGEANTAPVDAQTKPVGERKYSVRDLKSFQDCAVAPKPQTSEPNSPATDQNVSDPSVFAALLNKSRAQARELEKATTSKVGNDILPSHRNIQPRFSSEPMNMGAPISTPAPGRNGSPENTLTAAIAEPVTTNLDALPTGSSQKRKRVRERSENGTFISENSGPAKKQRGGRRGRGGRGSRGSGRIGRQRRSAPIVASSDDESITPPTFDELTAEDHAEENKSTTNIERKSPEDVGLHNTRRSVRISPDGAKGHSSTLATPEEGSKKPGQPLTAVKDETTPSKGAPSTKPARKLAPSASNPTSGQLMAEASLQPTNEALLQLGLSATSGRRLSFNSGLDTPMSGMSNAHAPNGADADKHDAIPTVLPSVAPLSSQANTTNVVNSKDIANAEKIEFLARVQTTSGTIEIPLRRSLLDDVNKLTDCISAFVDWKSQTPMADVDFKVFSSIFLMNASIKK